MQAIIKEIESRIESKKNLSAGSLEMLNRIKKDYEDAIAIHDDLLNTIREFENELAQLKELQTTK